MKPIAILMIALTLTACTQPVPARSAAEDEEALMTAMVEVGCLTSLTEESARELAEDEAMRRDLTAQAQAIYSKHGFTTDTEIDRANQIGQNINDDQSKLDTLKAKFAASDCFTPEDIEKFFTPLEELDAELEQSD